MKKIWNSPDIQDLTISETAKTDMNQCWYLPPCRPPKPSCPGGNNNPSEELS